MPGFGFGQLLAPEFNRARLMNALATHRIPARPAWLQGSALCKIISPALNHPNPLVLPGADVFATPKLQQLTCTFNGHPSDDGSAHSRSVSIRLLKQGISKLQWERMGGSCFVEAG
jgi:hypothetical protein